MTHYDVIIEPLSSFTAAASWWKGFQSFESRYQLNLVAFTSMPKNFVALSKTILKVGHFLDFQFLGTLRHYTWMIENLPYFSNASHHQQSDGSPRARVWKGRLWLGCTRHRFMPHKLCVFSELLADISFINDYNFSTKTKVVKRYNVIISMFIALWSMRFQFVIF